MNNNLKNFLLFILSLIISGILARPFGKLYEFIIGRPSEGGFWGPDPLLTNGFLFGIVFIFPFILSFGGKGKYYYIVIFAILNLLFYWGYWAGLVQDIILFPLGLILGLLLNQAYLKFSKNS